MARSIKKGPFIDKHLVDDIVRLEPEEAELAKLFTNTWRYIKFAASNQLYMMANDFGLDYERIRSALASGDTSRNTITLGLHMKLLMLRNSWTYVR